MSELTVASVERTIVERCMGWWNLYGPRAFPYLRLVLSPKMVRDLVRSRSQWPGQLSLTTLETEFGTLRVIEADVPEPLVVLDTPPWEWGA